MSPSAHPKGPETQTASVRKGRAEASGTGNHQMPGGYYPIPVCYGTSAVETERPRCSEKHACVRRVTLKLGHQEICNVLSTFPFGETSNSTQTDAYTHRRTRTSALLEVATISSEQPRIVQSEAFCNVLRTRTARAAFVRLSPAIVLRPILTVSPVKTW